VRKGLRRSPKRVAPPLPLPHPIVSRQRAPKGVPGRFVGLLWVAGRCGGRQPGTASPGRRPTDPGTRTSRDDKEEATTMRKHVLGVIGGMVLAAGGLLTAAPAFAATGCLHETCSGLDPTQSVNQSTGATCSAGATTPLSSGAFGGTLQLRWGPNCETNWTRFTPADNGQYEIWVTRL